MNVLLIEDDELVFATLKRLLTRRGYAVERMSSVAEINAWAPSTGYGPELVITDRDVIGGDAWVAVRAAVAAKRLPDNVIYMSGRTPAELPPRFWAKGLESISALLDLVASAGRIA